VKTTAVSDSKGFYSFTTLNVGVYDVSVSQHGFRDYVQTGVKIDANSALRIDITMQLGIARAVGGTNGLPAPVADALHTLLDGNVKKVLISVCLWMPYLLLSKRVNVTFRHRVEA